MKTIKSQTALCVAISLAAGQVFAQASANQKVDISNEEVIVIGTKIGKSVQDLEVSAEIFNADRLDNEQITELSDLLSKVPNVFSEGGADANFKIRGIGRSGIVAGAGQGVTSSVYVDGSPITSLNFNRGPLALWDIDQVEILRGPQSSVQGRNALAGAIFIKTTDPTFEPEGKVRASYAEGNSYQLSAAYGGPLIEGLLAGRIAVDSQGSDGFLTNKKLGEEDFNKTESLNIRAKLLMQPESLPQFSTKLTIDIGESEVFGEDVISIEFPAGVNGNNFVDFDPKKLDTQRDEIVSNDNENTRIVSETGYEFTDNLTGRAIITYEDYSTLRTFGDPKDPARFGGYTQNRFDDNILSLETRLEFDFDNLKGLVGLYYLKEARKSKRNQNPVLLVQARNKVRAKAGPAVAQLVKVTPEDSLLIRNTGETFDIKNYALFAQFDWQFAPSWKLGVGARYDVEDFAENDRTFSTAISSNQCEITAPSVVFNVPNANPLAPITLPCQTAVNAFFGPNTDPKISADFTAFLPRLSLTHDINEDSSVFVSLSRGYRAGGAFVARSENPSSVGFSSFVGEYDPEFLDTVEIGTRNLLDEGKLTLNGNIFYSEYQDQQVRVDGFDSTRTDDDLIVNAGESKLYGLEFIADYVFTDNLSAFFNLGILKTKFSEFPYAVDINGNPLNTANPKFANLVGDSFPGAPKLSFTIGADWKNNMGLFASASYSYAGKTESTIPNIGDSDVRNKLDDPDQKGNYASQSDVMTNLTGRFGWQRSGLKLYVFGTNLLDNDAYTSRNFASASRASGKLSLSSATYVVQKPRVVGVGFDYDF